MGYFADADVCSIFNVILLITLLLLNSFLRRFKTQDLHNHFNHDDCKKIFLFTVFTVLYQT